MIALLCFLLTLFASPFKAKSRLEAQNTALRHQLIVLRRRVSGRVRLTNGDRLFLVQLYRWFPSVLESRIQNKRLKIQEYRCRDREISATLCPRKALSLA